MPAERTVVFGGSGFIGSHLVQALSSRGTRVTVADIVPPKELPDGAVYKFCDVRQPIDNVFGEAERAYNLAAVHRTPGHPEFEYYDTNVAGALNVVEWASN